MKNFYISKALFAFGGSALSLFLPLFLFTKNVPLFHIFMFHSAMNLVHSTFVIPVTRLTYRIGIVPIFGIGVVLHALAYILTRLLDASDLFALYGLAGVFGLAGAFYYTAYHYILVSQSSRGSQLSNIKNISSTVNVVGPITGSFIVTYWDFSTMYAIFAMFMILAILPLLREKNLRLEKNPTLSEIKKEFKLGDILAFGVAFPCEEGTENMVWPLFMGATGIMSILSIGATYTGISVVMMFITRLIGWYIDRNDKRALVLSTVGITVMNILRCFKYSPVFLYTGLTMIAEAISVMVNSTIDHLCYDRARNGNKIAYIVFREITINAGNVLFYATGALLLNFPIMFAIAAIGSLGYIFFLRNESK